MTSDLLIVYSPDTEQWSQYLHDLLSEKSLNLQVKVKLHESVLRDEGLHVLQGVHACILIISPGLFDMLLTQPQLNYKPLITRPDRVLFFLCGVTLPHFKEAGVEDRFPNLDLISKHSHEAVNHMLEEAICIVDACDAGPCPSPVTPPPVHPRDPRKNSAKDAKLPSSWADTKPKRKKPKHKFTLIPDTIRCSESTRVAVVLDEDEDVDDDVNVQVIVEDQSLPEESCLVMVKLDRINPYTFTFKAPDLKEGKYAVKLVVKDSSHSKQFLTYKSQITRALEQSQIYLFCLDQVCTLALRQGIKCGTLDQALIGLFGEGWPIPTRAFESLFGVFEQGSTKSCRYELPTLLHLAAKFGLQELASQLLDLPGSSLANAIPNASNQYPNDLAKDKSPDLAAFLKEAKDSEQEVNDTYVTMMAQYYNTRPPGSEAESSGGLKYEALAGHNVLSKDPPYLCMSRSSSQRVQCHSEVHLDEVDSDSQEDYQEVDNPLDIKDPLPNSPRLPPVSFDQELISIMEAFKRGDHSLDQTEAHVQDLWKRVKTGGNSFEQKRENLAKIRNDLQKVKKTLGKQAPISIQHPCNDQPVQAPKPPSKPFFFGRSTLKNRAKSAAKTKKSKQKSSLKIYIQGVEVGSTEDVNFRAADQEYLHLVHESEPTASLHRMSQSSVSSRESTTSVGGNTSGFCTDEPDIRRPYADIRKPPRSSIRNSARIQAFYGLTVAPPPPEVPPRGIRPPISSKPAVYPRY